MKLNAFSLRLATVMAGVFLLSGCAQTEYVSHYVKKFGRNTGDTASAGAYKVGRPYKVGSVWYYPEESFQFVETGIASWYGPDFHGNRTANGEVYDQNDLTAAHRTLQMPSFVRVTNLENGRAVVLRVNDRGPFRHGRVIDVSRRGAELLGFINKGTARVRLEVLPEESRKIAQAARRGVSTVGATPAHYGGGGQPAPAQRQAAAAPLPPVTLTPPPPARVQLASLHDDAAFVPESLQTPTITVEELGAVTPPPSTVPAASLNFQPRTGRDMPAPIITTAPVRPTGLFVQAGAFAVYDNAQRLTQQLSSIAPATIEPVSASGGRTLYRVKLGPIATVAQADAVLERVIAAGQNTARVVRHN